MTERAEALVRPEWPDHSRTRGETDRPKLSAAVLTPGVPAGTSRTGTGRRWRRPRLAAPFAAIAGGLRFLDADERLERPIREGDQRNEGARRDAVFRRSLAVADLAAASAAAVISVAGFGHRSLEPFGLVALPLIVLAAKLVGLYDRDELIVNKATVDEAPRLFQLATLYTLLFALGQSQLVSARLGGFALVGLWATMFLLTVMARTGARCLAHKLTPVERCLFVGREESEQRLEAKLSAAGAHSVLVGRQSIGEGSTTDPRDSALVLGRAVAELRVHRVIIEPSEAHPQATLDLVREAKGTGVRVSLLPLILEVVGSSIEIDDVHGLTLLGVRRFGLSRSSAFVKRSFDLVGASLAFVLLSPLFAVLALLVRLSGPGPIVYRQTRIGRDGRPFTMLKFRTMVDGADALKSSLMSLNEADGLFKIENDPRLTSIGRWLRRYSLDELPQLVNVLRGEMSLVGPRPLVSDDDARVTGLDRRRLYLTPGMTGRWQILGSSRIPLAEMLKLDYLYVAGWSLWSDVKILIRTVPYVLARRGM